jgi:hypothetical protein
MSDIKSIQYSSYMEKAEKYINKLWINYTSEVKMIPWRQFRTDIVIWLVFIKILIEIDWDFHYIPKQWYKDKIKDLYTKLYWYKTFRIKTNGNFDIKLSKVIRKCYYYVIMTRLLRIFMFFLILDMITPLLLDIYIKL